MSAWWSPTAALAADRDEVTTSVGAQTAGVLGLPGGSDLDLILGERADWRLGTLGPEGDARLVLDGQFTVDPAGTTNVWERNRVASLAVSVRSGGWLLDLGRTPVREGGPRLVDGVQVARQSGRWIVGGWAGAAPDLFTTRPAARFGGGPSVSRVGRTLRAGGSLEVLAAPDGLDRVGALVSGAWSAAPVLEVSTRADLQVTDASGTPGLADGALAARWQPRDGVTLGAVYDAFSTLRYLSTDALDPDRQRFTDRLLAGGVVDPTLFQADPRLYHLAGLDARWAGGGGGAVIPHVSASVRARWHPDPELRYARGGPVVGVSTERVDVSADAQLQSTEDGLREEVGLTAVVDVVPSGLASVDGSVRLLLDPTWGGPGFYSDLFVDVIGTGAVVVVAGGSVLVERTGYSDPGLGAFLRLQHRIRRERP
jgi:hypothetical protein